MPNLEPATTTVKTEDPPPAAPAPIQTDADRLGEKYRTQLAALAKDGAAKFNFVDYAPPAFVIFHDQLALQVSVRNTIAFGSGTPVVLGLMRGPPPMVVILQLPPQATATTFA